MLEHVTSELALAIERDVTDLAHVRFLLLLTRRICVLAGSRLREFVLVPFPKVQRRIVQIVLLEIVDRDFTPLPSLNATFIPLDAIALLGTIVPLFFRRSDLRIIFLGRRWFFHHVHTQGLWDAKIIVFQFYYQKS